MRYAEYNDIVYLPFPDPPDVEAESSDALVPVVRLLSLKRNIILLAEQPIEIC